jgi:neutral ceramidase
MKRFFIITASILFLLIILFFILTRPVDHTPYFETDFYQKSQLQIDSLKKIKTGRNESLQAGFSQVSITPLLNQQDENISMGKFMKVPLAGYGGRKGAPATGVHDSIYIKAAALRSGNTLAVFVTADLLIMPPEIVDSAMVLLSNQGIDRRNLIFSATHTHSSLGAWGSGFVGKQFAGEENNSLKKWLSLKITEAVLAAVDDLKPARLGSGSFSAGEFTRNRLTGEKGTKNDEFSFILIEQPGYKKAVIGSFAAHSTTLGDENLEISADYPGFWARKMEQTSVDYALFLAGSMGSQSPVSKGEGFDKPEYIGESLADSLNKYLVHTNLKDKPELSLLSLQMPLPDFRFRLTTRRTLSNGLSKKMMPHPGTAYLQAVRLDSMIWIATPSDFSGEYALQVKYMLATKGFESNITGFNGSYVGYIIPGRYFYLDKYEPKTMGWFGPYMGDYTMDLITQLSTIIIQE